MKEWPAWENYSCNSTQTEQVGQGDSSPSLATTLVTSLVMVVKCLRPSRERKLQEDGDGVHFIPGYPGHCSSHCCSACLSINLHKYLLIGWAHIKINETLSLVFRRNYEVGHHKWQLECKAPGSLPGKGKHLGKGWEEKKKKDGF